MIRSTSSRLAAWRPSCDPGRRGSDVTALAAFADARVASGSRDCKLWVRDLKTGLVMALEGNCSLVTVVVAAPVEGRFVSGSADATLPLWDLELDDLLTLCTLDAPVRTVAGLRSRCRPRKFSGREILWRTRLPLCRGRDSSAVASAPGESTAAEDPGIQHPRRHHQAEVGPIKSRLEENSRQGVDCELAGSYNIGR